MINRPAKPNGDFHLNLDPEIQYWIRQCVQHDYENRIKPIISAWDIKIAGLRRIIEHANTIYEDICIQLDKMNPIFSHIKDTETSIFSEYQKLTEQIKSFRDELNLIRLLK